MTIPLSMQGDEADPVYGGTAPGTRSFLITDPYKGGIEIPAFNEVTEDGRGAGVATSVSKLGGRNNNAGYLMLIPQSQSLDFTVNWTNAPSNFERTINTNMDFEAGKLYQIIINFVGSGITIALIEAGAWDYQVVKHTFE